MSHIADFLKRIWRDEWFLSLPTEGKLLFINLFSNEDTALSGIYELSIAMRSLETGIKPDEIDRLMDELDPKVLYDRDAQHLIWVTNYVRHQFMRGDKVSPSIVKGIWRSLRDLNKPQHPFVKGFCERYPEILSSPEQLKPKVIIMDEVEAAPPAKKSKPKRPERYQDNPQFVEFWEAYPRKDGGPTVAYKKWPWPMDDALYKQIMDFLEGCIKSDQWQEKDKIPMAQTWLNQKRWEGELPAEKGSGTKLSAPSGKYKGVGDKVSTDG